MAFDVTLIVIDTISWSDFPPVTYNVGDSVDLDLWTYLQSGFGGIVTRDPTGDAFPMNLAIQNGRYLRGTVSESGVFTVRFIATEQGESEISGDFVITVEMAVADNALYTDKNGLVLYSDKDGNPLYTSG